MLRHREPREETVEFLLDGKLRRAAPGECLAAVLMREEPAFARTSPVGGRRRAPYCMMGVCFECLVEINGVPNQQACLVRVDDDLVVRRQSGAPRPTDAGHGRDL
jgi:predicted molibdopterin-dependent oxidoreductase YjgC